MMCTTSIHSSPFPVWPHIYSLLSMTEKKPLNNLKTYSLSKISRLFYLWLSLFVENNAGKQMHIVFVCFCPPTLLIFFFLIFFPFFLALLSIFHPTNPPPPPFFHSLPPLISGSTGVHMIKQGTQVITWHCQIKRPLIQIRSEISKSSVAFCSQHLSTQETERRSESSGTCREATTTLSLPFFLDKYHQWEQQSPDMPRFTHCVCVTANPLLTSVPF